MEFTRITIDPKQMAGVPCIRHLRVPVVTVVRMVANGMSVDEILQLYPYLERDDISEALHYAAAFLEKRTLRVTPGL